MPLVPEKLKDIIKNLLIDHLAENKTVHDFRLLLGYGPYFHSETALPEPMKGKKNDPKESNSVFVTPMSFWVSSDFDCSLYRRRLFVYFKFPST